MGSATHSLWSEWLDLSNSTDLKTYVYSRLFVSDRNFEAFVRRDVNANSDFDPSLENFDSVSLDEEKQMNPFPQCFGNKFVYFKTVSCFLTAYIVVA